MSRVTLNFPEELKIELESAAKRNYRTFTAEVVARCVEHTSPRHHLDVYQASPLPTPAAQVMPNVHTPDVYHTSPIHQIDITHTSDESPLERAETVDMLPDDGDARNSKSNFRVRRNYQVELLQAAWTEMFPDASPLIKDTVVRWLPLADNRAVEVLLALETAQAAKVQPVGLRAYIGKVLESGKQRREAERKAREQDDWEDRVAREGAHMLGWDEDDAA